MSSTFSTTLPKKINSRIHKGYAALRLIGLTLGIRLAFGLLVLLAIVFLSLYGLEMARTGSSSGLVERSLEQTVAYIGRVLKGDLGETIAGSITLKPERVVDVFPEMVIRSFGLLGFSLLIAVVLGVLTGLVAARFRHSGWSLGVLLITIVGVSLPSFLAALLLQIGVIQLTRILGHSVLPVGGFGWDKRIILPALVLAARPLAQIARVTFITVSDTLDQDYVRTAHSKGIRPYRILLVHVIRNAAVPVLTTIGVSLRFSLSSLPVVEYFFGWPGLGFNLLRAISLRDDNLAVILLLSLGLLFIFVNILLDLSYRLIDPRLRETPDHVRMANRGGIIGWLRASWESIKDLAKNNPISSWLRQRNAPQEESPFQAILIGREDQIENGNGSEQANSGRVWIQGTIGNLPFLLGFIIIAGLITIIIFGPDLTPHSPYTTQGLTIIDGKMQVPPFAPNEVHTWGTDVLGRDLLSLILAGAQQTLMLAFLVMLARLVVGFLLGAVAGWLNNTWLDRGILGLAEIISAFPTLLLAMILILALGIRQGVQPFVIALCFVGWGEVMQFVRSEVLSIRPKLFIESAAALGVSTSRIILKHVLPNLIPALISLAALETGAVLMLLGELGFIGIFIGGGAFAELDVASQPYHYSDVPEWAALLSNVRTYARSYPWTALYPSLAFFVAILGFNLFGEGLRRFIEIVGVRIAKVINRYTLAGVLVMGAAFFWFRGSSGALAYYQRQAENFNSEQALAYITDLCSPEMEGRALNSSGVRIAAEYIASQFEELDIQAAGEEFTYFQTRPRSYVSIKTPPYLSISDGGPDLTYHKDFVECTDSGTNLGEGEGPIRVLAFGALMRQGNWGQFYSALNNRNHIGEVILVVDQRSMYYAEMIPKSGLLVVADENKIGRKSTLTYIGPYLSNISRSVEGMVSPVLWISEEVANRLLADSGQTVAELRKKAAGLQQDEVFEMETGVHASLGVDGIIEEKAEALHVIGHLPGVSATGETKMDNHMVVVVAKYDAPPNIADGDFFPGANDNASGVALLLEAIRNMRLSGYEPYRTFLFVAYSSEGLEYGEPVTPDVKKFLQTKYGFSSTFTIDAVIELRGLGGSDGDELVLAAGGNQRLAQLFEDSARRVGVPVNRARENVDMSIVFREQKAGAGQDYPYMQLSWEGWESSSQMQFDTVEAISEETLGKAGRAISLGLMILGRELDY